mgnify:CR=1 FL=1
MDLSKKIELLIQEKETRANEESKRVLDIFRRHYKACLLYTSPSPRDRTRSRMPSSAWKKKN